MASLGLCCTILLFASSSSSVVAFSPSNRHDHRATLSPSPRCLAGPTSSSNAIDDFDDFADFASTQVVSSSSNDNGASFASNKDDDPFLLSLQSRVQQVQAQSNTLPLMILDTMLPRQVLQIQIQHPTLKSLLKHRVSMEMPTLGMLGLAKTLTGQTVPLKAGVEVEIIEMDKAANVAGSIGDEMPWDVSLRAGRRFVIEGGVEKVEKGWTEARVRFLDSSIEEEGEVQSFTSNNTGEEGNASSSSGVGLGDRMSVARAISKSRQFTEPNMSMKGNVSLVDRWIELARQNERLPGQIDALLRQLGEIPPEHEPTERAFWVGALINPLPSMGVAMEIRPALLLQKRAEERVQVALDGILRSIRHMDGTSKMW